MKLKKLKVIPDERGRLMEIFRVSEQGIQPKQVYMTTALEGVVKDKHAFHMHQKQTDAFCCVSGEILLVMVNPKTHEVIEMRIGDHNPYLVIIPPGMLHAFKSLKGESVIINCIDCEYSHDDPDEYRIPNQWYDWDKEVVSWAYKSRSSIGSRR